MTSLREYNYKMELKSSGSADSHVIEYRADLDGLRAIAVLSVIFFHLTHSALPGGYLGVDMFFVISGYLITSIIWREAQDEQFSIVRFYDRRIRRIMPALLLLLFVTTLASVALLLPADLIGYGKSLLATLVFAANNYFWHDTNYFTRIAEYKPLLHLWSLGVEEQFYILFPLILALLARWWRRGAVLVIALLTIGSLTVNGLALLAGADTAAFYLLPTRAWELGLGALLALLPSRSAPRAAKASLVAAIGALLLISGIVYPLQAFRVVPVAVPAVTGVALLILAGKNNCPAVNRVLRLRPLVFVGLISYSLYLWHWPIIVFGQYYLVREFRLSEIVAALGLMTACAIGSWRFIESPFRSRKLPIQTVRYAAGAGVLALAAAAAALLWSHGLPGRLNAEAAAINEAVGADYHCPASDYILFDSRRACLMNLPSRNPADADVVLLGNSHAQMYAPVWASILAERGQTGLLIPVNACLPTVQANISRDCIDVAMRNLAQVAKLARARTVILALTWWHEADKLVDSTGRTVDNRNSGALVAALDDLLDQLRQAGKQVVLIGPIAQPGWDIASTISRQLAFGHPVDGPSFLPASDFALRFGPAIQHFEARADIGFVRPDRVQCPAERCFYLLDGRSLFADDSHIAAAELQRFRTLFTAALPPQVAPQR
jgi:peptidoglycan/LPS O-acetylase OafA/YrhL